jgi:enoyl-CoA hydratase
VSGWSQDGAPIAFWQVDGVGVLRVNRPKARNALNWAAQTQFAAIVQALTEGAHPDVHALIITGSGERAFVAGGDVKEHVGQTDPAVGVQVHETMSHALHQLTQLPIPVMAAINGDAYGGGWEIVTACDLRLMHAEAMLHFVQVRVGLTTGWGGTARLVRLIGLSRALHLLLTAQSLSARDARQMGLVHHLVPESADTLTAAVTWAQALIDLPRDALANLKRLAWDSAESHLSDAALEKTLFTALWPSANHQEALNAFIAKRPPRFNG